MSQFPADGATFQGPSGHRKPWLLIFNCQGIGLANCLNLLCDQIDVEYYIPTDVTKNHDAIVSRLGFYERVLVAPWVENHFGLNLGESARIWRLPAFSFSGYHPDLCHVSVVGGPMRGLHSALAVAAFHCGLSVQKTLGLYGAAAYSAMGYFEQWPLARDLLVSKYKIAGVDIEQAVVDWSRHGPFTHFPDHPKIECLRDISKAVLDRVGMKITETDLLPHDNLSNGGAFPIYPEIGSRLGVRGDYLFKPAESFHLIGLEEFISASFQFYRDSGGVNPMETSKALVHRAISVIQSIG